MNLRMIQPEAGRPADETLQQERFLFLLKALVLATLAPAALLFAALVVCDPVLRERYPLGLYELLMPRSIPWLFAPYALAICSIVAALYAARNWLFQHRHVLPVVALLIPGAISGVNVGRLDAFDVILMTSALAWVGMMLIEQRPLRTERWLMAALLGIAACAVASVINGKASTIVGLPSMVNKIVLIVLITNLVTTRRLFEVALITFVALAAASAAIGLITEGLYFWTGYVFTMHDFEEFHYKATPFGLMLRATALHATPQALGHMLVLALAVTLLGPWRRRVRLPLAALMLAGVTITFSTSVYVVAGMVVALWPAVRRPSRAIHHAVLLSITGLVLYLSGAVQWLYTILVQTGGDAADDRVEYMRVAFDVIRRHPFVGIGLNNFGRALEIPVHNAFLQMACEIGLIGGSVFAVLIGALLLRSIAVARIAPGERSTLYLRGLALGMVTLTAHFFFEPLYDNVVSWTFLGLVASAMAIYVPAVSSAEREL